MRLALDQGSLGEVFGPAFFVPRLLLGTLPQLRFLGHFFSGPTGFDLSGHLQLLRERRVDGQTGLNRHFEPSNEKAPSGQAEGFGKETLNRTTYLLTQFW